MTPTNQKNADSYTVNFKPKAAYSPNDRFTKLINNQIALCKTQAKMGQWQLALRTLADHVDALVFHGRPDLLAILCNDAASILADKGAPLAGAKLRRLAVDIFAAPNSHDQEFKSACKQVVPTISRGVQEIRENEIGHPLSETIDVRQSIILAQPKSGVPLEVPELMTDSQKALYRLVNEEMGPYEQNTLCLKLDSWDEMALALIHGRLGTEFPYYPQRTVAGKLLEVGERDQILFCYNESDGRLEAGASALLYERLNTT